MKATAELLPKDYRKFKIFAYFKYSYSHWFLLAVWLLLTFNMGRAISQKPEYSHHWIFAYVASSIFVFLTLSVVYAALIVLQLVLPKKIKNVYGTHTWEVSDSTIKESNTQGTMEVKFNQLKYHDRKEHVFISQKNGISMIIPKRADLDSVDFFENLAQKIQTTNKSL